MEGSSPKSDPNFFIFGPERSGTTLLAFLLSGQPETFCINDSFVLKSYIESTFWRSPNATDRSVRSLVRLATDLIPAVASSPRSASSPRLLIDVAQNRHLALRHGPRRHTSAAEVDRFLHFLRVRYEAKHAKTSFLREYSDSIDGIASELRQAESKELGTILGTTVRQLAKNLNSNQAASLVGEKTPIHTIYWQWILEVLFPDSKSVVVIRHPITNIASIEKRSASLEEATRRYRRFASVLPELAARPRVTVVRYEDLIHDTGSVIAEVASDLGIDFDSTLPIAEYAKEGYTGNTIDPARNPKPDEVLTPDQRAQIRREFEALMMRFDYS